jgi:hypothetical protein
LLNLSLAKALSRKENGFILCAFAPLRLCEKKKSLNIQSSLSIRVTVKQQGKREEPKSKI